MPARESASLPDPSLQQRDIRIHTDFAGELIIMVLCVDVRCVSVAAGQLGRSTNNTLRYCAFTAFGRWLMGFCG